MTFIRKLMMLLVVGMLSITVVSAQEGASFKFSDVREGQSAEAANLAGVRLFSAPQTRSIETRGSVTLSHNAEDVLENNVSFACTTDGTKITRENSYYRIFKMSDFSITNLFEVKGIAIGIASSVPGGYDVDDAPDVVQPISVRLYLLNGALIKENMTLIASKDYTIGYGIAQYANLDINTFVYPDETLVVEIFVPNGHHANHEFYLGANKSGQTSPSYIRAAECSVPNPVNVANLGAAYQDVSWVLSVNGDIDGIQAEELLSNGNFELSRADNAKLPFNWNAKKVVKDKLKANKPEKDKVFAYQGLRAFQFKSTPESNAKLVQKLTGGVVNDILTHDQLTFSAAIERKNLSAGGRVKIRVKYKDENLPTGKINLDIPQGTGDYALVTTTEPYTFLGDVKTIKVVIENRSTTGKYLVDFASLQWGLTALVRHNEAHVLPLPINSP